MYVIKVTRKYQITIPKRIREMLNIRVGDKLAVRVEGGRIIIEPVVPVEGDPLEHMLSLVREPVELDAVRLVEESWDED